jgi:hypothetical protein
VSRALLLAIVAIVAIGAATPAPAQRLGLDGFGLRSGLDLNSRQVLVGGTLDAGDLVGARLRLRATGELGGFRGPSSVTVGLDALYRFTGDADPVVPYVGGGLAVAGHDGCGTDRGCPALWVGAVFGFEIRYRSTFSWVLEYRGLDAFRHNRLYLGLTTRRGT